MTDISKSLWGPHLLRPCGIKFNFKFTFHQPPAITMADISTSLPGSQYFKTLLSYFPSPARKPTIEAST